MCCAGKRLFMFPFEIIQIWIFNHLYAKQSTVFYHSYLVWKDVLCAVTLGTSCVMRLASELLDGTQKSHVPLHDSLWQTIVCRHIIHAEIIVGGAPGFPWGRCKKRAGCDQTARGQLYGGTVQSATVGGGRLPASGAAQGSWCWVQFLWDKWSDFVYSSDSSVAPHARPT